MSLAQKREELIARQKSLRAIFDEAGPDLDMAKVKSIAGDSAAKASEIKRLNTELGELGKEVDTLVELERASKGLHEQEAQSERPVERIVHPSPAAPVAPVQKSLGQLFVESDTYTKRLGNKGPSSFVPDVDLKVLMTTAAGWAIDSMRTPGFVASVQQQPSVLDLLPFATSSNAGFTYMLETTFTNNAAGRAEGANNAGEAALALTATPILMVEHAVWLPITREQMDDVAYVSSYVTNRLSLMLKQTLNAAIMVGAGAPSFTGLIGMAGVNTQAKGADPVLDAIYKGMVAVQVTGRANPSAIVINPLDFQDIRLTRTADGVYIFGSPMDPNPPRIWGLPVVQESSSTAGTAVVGDFATYSQLVQYKGITFEYTDAHASLFIQRTLAVLASVRSQFIVDRPSAFTQVTGI